MALGFFRRHQKMVMIIMVILMVSFLITTQGFQSCTQQDPMREVIGTTAYGDIRRGDLVLAGNDFQVLRHLLGDPRSPLGLEFAVLSRMSDNDRALAYALLLREAIKNNVRVGDADVDGILASMGLTGESYTGFLSQLRAMRISESQFRGAMERILAVHKMFATGLIMTPPSERELRYTIRDFFEKIDLRVMEFPAERHLEKVENTLDPNIVREQFLRCRDLPPGQFREEDPFGFGYRQPDRVQVVYAYISRQVVERAVRPTRKETNDYFVANPGEFTRMTRPATTPASGAATAPLADDANRLVIVQMTPEEARPIILRKLSAANAARKIDELTAKFRALLEAGPAGGVGPYQSAWSKLLLTGQANAALDTRIDTSSIGTMKLEAAVDRLAEKVQRADPNLLRAIVFPFGTHLDANGQDSLSLSPEIQVHLEGSMTLREALAKICEQAKWLPIEWDMCAGLEGVLFPKAGEGAVDFFPLVVHQTGLLDTEEFRKDAIRANAQTLPPMRADMLVLAFTAQPLVRQRQPWQTWEPMKEGEDGRILGVATPAQNGIVLWRLLQALPGRAPPEMTDEIRRQVEKDIRLRKAFDLAYQEAERIRSEEQFAAADANGEANSAYSTGFFPRRDARTEDWTVLPRPELPPSAAIRKAFIDAAFSLAPGEGGGASISPVRMPSIRRVLVLRRMGFQPVTQGDYELYRAQLMRMLGSREAQMSIQVWFALPAIEARVNWKQSPQYAPSRGPEPPPEPD